jgi:hypothetical protein
LGVGKTFPFPAIRTILLAVHSLGAILPQWFDRVITCRPIEGLRGVRRPRPRALWPVDATNLVERLLAGQNGRFGGIGTGVILTPLFERRRKSAVQQLPDLLEIRPLIGLPVIEPIIATAKIPISNDRGKMTHMSEGGDSVQWEQLTAGQIARRPGWRREMVLLAFPEPGPSAQCSLLTCPGSRQPAMPA